MRVKIIEADGTIRRRTMDFARTVRSHAAAPRKHVPRPVYRERMTACKACEHWKPTTERCGLCGCFAKLKLRWTTSQCPDKPPRWTRYEGEVDGC